MSVDNFSDHQPPTLNHGEPPTTDQGLPSRQILFLASGIEEAVPPHLFTALSRRYQAEILAAHQGQQTPQFSRYLLHEGFNVIIPSLLNTKDERQPYCESAQSVTGALVLTLCLKRPDEKRHPEDYQAVQWADDMDDNGVLTLHRPDTAFSLLMIDWHLRRRMGAYDSAMS